METFASLAALANAYLAAESTAISSMEGSDTDHVLRVMDYLAWARQQREAIYARPAWKAHR